MVGVQTLPAWSACSAVWPPPEQMGHTHMNCISLSVFVLNFKNGIMEFFFSFFFLNVSQPFTVSVYKLARPGCCSQVFRALVSQVKASCHHLTIML